MSSAAPLVTIRPQFALFVVAVGAMVALAQPVEERQRMLSAYEQPTGYSLYGLIDDDFDDRPKRDDGPIPGVLRFGKRAQSFVRFGRSDYITKKEMPGVLRFGKRSSVEEKKAVPGVLRFGKRDADDMPGVLRFGKRDADMPGVLRFGKRDADDMPGVLRFGKRDSEMPGMLRFGRSEMPGVLRFGRK